MRLHWVKAPEEVLCTTCHKHVYCLSAVFGLLNPLLYYSVENVFVILSTILKNKVEYCFKCLPNGCFQIEKEMIYYEIFTMVKIHFHIIKYRII